jgi:hypothetical protein
MFPRTEAQAKATCIVILVVIIAAVAYLAFRGIDVRHIGHE